VAEPMAADGAALVGERTDQSPGSRLGTRLVFAGLFLLYMFDYLDREIVSSVIPFLKTDLGITDVQAGTLASAVYWAIVALVIPVSILIDRWSRTKSVGIMVMLWSLATGAAAFVRTFPQLLLTRVGVGAGEAGYSPGGTAMISAMYPPEKRSRMMGIWNASIPLGSAIGVGLGGVIAKHLGWKSAFGIVAIPGFVIGLLFLVLARDYRTVKLEIPASGSQARRKMQFRDVAREFLHKPSLLLTYVGFAGNTFLTSAFLTWLPSYFNRTQGVPADKAGLKASAVMLTAIVGAPLGGILVDRWRKRNIAARPLFAGLTSLLSAAVWLVALLALRGGAQYAVMFLAAACTLLYLSAAAAVTQDVVHPGLWALSYGLSVIIQNAGGSAWGPIVVGALSDRWGIQRAIASVPVAGAVAGLLFLAAAAFYRRDLGKVAPVSVEMMRRGPRSRADGRSATTEG
jgi:MFS family permease